jgi:hypothetical protein
MNNERVIPGSHLELAMDGFGGREFGAPSRMFAASLR